MTEREDALVDVIATLTHERDMWRREAEQLRDTSHRHVNEIHALKQERDELRRRLDEQRPCHLADFGKLVEPPHHGGKPSDPPLAPKGTNA